MWGSEEHVLAFVTDENPTIVSFYTIDEIDEENPGEWWMDYDINEDMKWGYSFSIKDMKI